MNFKKLLITLLTTLVLFVGIQNLGVWGQSTCSSVGDTCCDAAFGAKSCGLNLECNTATNKCVSKSCGGQGQACCNGTIAGSQYCAGNLVCKNNACANAPAAGASDITCGDGTSIDTAIGCIPFGDQNQLIGFFLRWGIGIGGGIAFLLILLAGFQIMTSRGDPKRLQAGQELMTSAIAGILLLIFSLVILRIIGFDILGINAFL